MGSGILQNGHDPQPQTEARHSSHGASPSPMLDELYLLEGSGQSKYWRFCPPAPAELLRALPEHPLLVQVAYNRGLHDAAGMRAFLDGEDAVRENPFKLCDMDKAVARILRAIQASETICVYGDFDADGVASTALLVSALQAAGGRVGPYIPDRVDEGYGLNVDALSTIAEKAQLLITVDCGIRSLAEVRHAQELGMDVIVTDHHSIGPALPDALAVVNPRRADCPSTFDRLAGVGVAYRLAQAVLRTAGEQPGGRLDMEQVDAIERDLLDLVALGTVADMMPLLGENRSLVRRGLAQLNRATRPGLDALMQQAELRPGTVDATAISFRLGPRLNAAGRLAHAKLAYRLLRTQDPVEAYTVAAELEALNQRRRSLTETAQTAAETQLAATLDADPAILFVHSPELPSGIVGLVAGKLTDRYYRPAVVVEQGEEESRGSARSIAEFDISRALDQVGDSLVRYGGHSRAAGFTVRTEKLAQLQAALTELADVALGDRSRLRPTLTIDAEVDLADMTWSLREQMGRLEPTGYENPAPLFLAQGARVRDVRTVGSGKHLRLVVDKDPHSPVLDVIAFQRGDWADRLEEGTRVDLAFHLETNEWQGRQMLQLNVQDMRLAQEEA